MCPWCTRNSKAFVLSAFRIKYTATYCNKVHTCNIISTCNYRRSIEYYNSVLVPYRKKSDLTTPHIKKQGEKEDENSFHSISVYSLLIKWKELSDGGESRKLTQNCAEHFQLLDYNYLLSRRDISTQKIMLFSEFNKYSTVEV